MAARHDLLAQIWANRRRTIYLMAGFTIFVVGVAAVFELAFAGGPIVLAVAIVVALAVVWTGYFYSDRVAIAVARGRPAGPDEYPRLHPPGRGALPGRRAPLEKGQVPAHAALGVAVQPTDDGHGVAVVSVDPGSAADKAGLQTGDVITKVDGTVVDSPDTLGAAIAAHQPADHVTVTYTRNGSSTTVDATLGTRSAAS